LNPWNYSKDQKVRREPQDLKDLLDHKVNKVRKGYRAIKVHRDHKVNREPQELLD
jgi:hypothetical protein